eukprot:TRINITY_DN6545_c0_g1_i4.p1 TRINITY_DN6545_c0_g1~~TRINITY_DN6545_c0_g1_i4.p1  ORF type:complete len:469 (-),score=86.96 TRINITY_DN6545_c0_g1_i4:28-1434(-)
MALRVGFLHPDLGIGGAERLVVDAALGLKNKGHDVCIYTAHHDPEHCFQETKDGTLRVQVHGDWMPRHIFQHFFVVFAILRSFWTSIALVLFERQLDVIVVDQVSATIPLLRLLTLGRTRIVFYCHFPDKLQTSRNTFIKRLYRMPIDWWEEVTTGMAHTVVVNSKFTGKTFSGAFPSIQIIPDVLYPALNLTNYDAAPVGDEGLGVDVSNDKSIMFLSFNRFERKKDLKLALDAFALLRQSVSPAIRDRLRLVLAGGYDHRVRENVEHLEELKTMAGDLGLGVGTVINGREAGSSSPRPVADGLLSSKDGSVSFVLSFTEGQRAFLLRHCVAMLYTPSNEHFGIGPLEGMYASKPVVAVNLGGPLESVVDGVTGYLRPPEAQPWFRAMEAILQAYLNDKKAYEAMGRAGRSRVSNTFSLECFASTLDRIVRGLSPTEGEATGAENTPKQGDQPPARRRATKNARSEL